MNVSSFFSRHKPTTPEECDPRLVLMYKRAMACTDGRPAVVAAAIQAQATLALADELKELRQMLASGEGAVTIALEGKR